MTTPAPSETRATYAALAHSDTEHAAPTFSRGFGFHPVLAFVDHGQDGTGEPLSFLLRRGNAGSSTAADQLTVLDTADVSRPAGMRVNVRKEKPDPGAQLRITDVDSWRVTAFAINTPPAPADPTLPVPTGNDGTAAGPAARTGSVSPQDSGLTNPITCMTFRSGARRLDGLRWSERGRVGTTTSCGV